jgi:hypothetical protein
MRFRIAQTVALPLTMVAAMGCEKTPRDKLQGRWLGEAIENVPASQLAKTTGWVKGTALEFAGNKVTITIPAEAPRTGTFKVSKVEGERMLVSFVREEGGHDEAELRFTGDRTLRWVLGTGPEVVLVKARN